MTPTIMVESDILCYYAVQSSQSVNDIGHMMRSIIDRFYFVGDFVIPENMDDLASVFMTSLSTPVFGFEKDMHS